MSAAGRLTPEGLRIGTLAGVPVLVARSWLVIAAVVTYLFAPTVAASAPGLGAWSYLVAFGYAVLLLLSVLLHELAHAVAAQAFGMPATHIVINLWGGHTQFETDAVRPGRSFVIAVVGPLANAVLALLAAPLLLADLPDVARLLVWAFVLTNGVVAVFNLVPGLPLDGGRLLEALVWKLTSDRTTGTVVAAWGGRVVAAAVIGWGLLPLLSGRLDLVRVVWAVLIGGLLWSGAGSVLRGASIRRRAPEATVHRLARPAVPLPASVSVADALAAAGVSHPADLGRTTVLLLGEAGEPVGVLDPGAASQVPAERRASVPASAAARAFADDVVLDVRLGGEELLRLLGTLRGEEWPVRDEAGHWVGVLRGGDVVAALVGSRPARRRR